MSIQFACPSCRSAIEVDDDMAGRDVTCPYCRHVVTTPATSTIAASEAGPPAATAAGSPVVSLPSQAPGGAAPKNWFATLGLVCAVVVGLSVFGLMMVAVKIARDHPVTAGTPLTVQQVQEYLKQDPALLGAFGLCVMMLFVGCVGGIVFSVLGLTRRPGRRWQAIAGLTVCGFLLLYVCLGFMTNAMRGRAG